MKSHFSMSHGVAMACAVSGAASMMSHVASAALVAADYATNSTYASGWAEGTNGGFGFGPWSMFGTGNSPIENAMDNSSPFNPFGTAWTLYLPDGTAVGCPNPPDGGGDLSRVGRSFAPLQVGQTVTTVFANPTERHFYNGYTFRLVSGTNNVVYNGTAIERFAVYAFEYFSYGRWFDSAGSTSLHDTDTAAGVRVAVTLTGPNNYRLVMTPLAN